MNEIIYIFCNSGVDVIVFEDIDRYDDNLIFSKLRELSFLVNRKLNKNNPSILKKLVANVKRFVIKSRTDRTALRFLYLLRDDIFKSKDRTKFFDMIIPVVPVIDNTNSLDKVLEVFKGDSIVESDLHFLQKLSLYIDEMRILKNIYNEYIIYAERLSNVPKLKRVQLLAIITYKNIFPYDFSQTQLGLGRGVLFRIFESKPQIIENAIQSLDIQIKNLQEDLKYAEAMYESNLDELDALYITLPDDLRIDEVESSSIPIRELVKKLKNREKCKIEVGKPSTSYYDSSINYRYSSYDPTPLFEVLKQNKEYVKKKAILDEGKGKYINRIKEQIQAFEYNKKTLKIKKLYHILDISNNIDIDLQLHLQRYDDRSEEWKEYHRMTVSHYFPLIKFLLRNGHIDETYTDYLTYFYPNSLTPEDKVFLLSITNSEILPPDHRLNNVNMIISRLEDNDYSRKEVLNFTLLVYALYHDNKISKLLLNNIVQNKRVDFVYDFLAYNSELLSKSNDDLEYPQESLIVDRQKFFKALLSYWPMAWSSYAGFSRVTDRDKLIFFYNCFEFLSLDQIKAMNANRSLTNYINLTSDFLRISTFSNVSINDIDKISKVFESLEIKFTAITKPNKVLLQMVYDGCFYEINIDNIESMLNDIHDSVGQTSNQYTRICDFSESKLYSYIHKFINKYMEILLKDEQGGVFDSQDAAVGLLNNHDLDTDKKKSYISRLKTTIDELSRIDTSLWEDLLNNGVILYSTQNVLTYFYDYAGMFDKILVDFFSSNQETIYFSRKDMGELYGKEKAVDFFYKAMQCNDLPLDNYRMIFDGYRGYSKQEFDYANIDNDKMEILIEYAVISFSVKSLIFIRENYSSDITNSYIKKNLDKYIEFLDKFEFSNDEALYLLSQKGIKEAYYLVLAKKIRIPVSVQSIHKSFVLISYILMNNFDKADFPFIVQTGFYDSMSQTVKDIINRLSVEHLTLWSQTSTISNGILEFVLKSDVVDYSSKIKLMIKHINKLPKEKAMTYFAIFEKEEFTRVMLGENPKFKNTNENILVLKEMKRLGWISSYKELKDGDTIQAYSKRKKSSLV